MKADATSQWRLLDLADLDTRLAQLAHRRRACPEAKQADDTAQQLATVHDEVVRARTAHDDVQREVAKAEADVTQVRERMRRNQSRLDAGQASAKDLQALAHEVDSLKRRQGVLEDEELAIMERAEGLQHALDEASEREDTLRSRLADHERARDQVLADIDAERADVERQRADVRAGVGADLLALYEKISGQTGGVGAAALVARRCNGCHIELGTVDLGRIRDAAADDVVRCEECRRILVRTAESGL